MTPSVREVDLFLPLTLPKRSMPLRTSNLLLLRRLPDLGMLTRSRVLRLAITHGYMDYTELESYDIELCASKCDAIADRSGMSPHPLPGNIMNAYSSA